MKKVDILIPQLIVALVALAGSVVNFLSLFISLPEWLSILSAGVMLIASALWLILYFVNTKKAASVEVDEPAEEETSKEANE